MRSLVQFAKQDLIMDNLNIAEIFNLMNRLITPDPQCLKDQPSNYASNALEHLRLLWLLFEDNHQLLIESEMKDEHYFTGNVYQKLKDEYGSLIIILHIFKHSPPARTKEPPASPRDKLIRTQHEHFSKLHELIKNTNVDDLNKQWLIEEGQHKLYIHWTPIENGHWEIRHQFHGALPDTGYELSYIRHKILYQTTLSLLNYKIDAIYYPLYRVIAPIGIPTWRMFDMCSEVNPFSAKSQVWGKLKVFCNMLRNNKVSEVDKRQLLIRTFLSYQVTHISTWRAENPMVDPRNINPPGPEEPFVPVPFFEEVD